MENQSQKDKQRLADFEAIADEIMDMLDWHKIHETMEFLNWKWATSDFSVPTIKELQDTARELMLEAWEKKVSIATGGFYVTYHQYDDGEEGLQVYFALTEASAYVNVNHEVKIY